MGKWLLRGGGGRDYKCPKEGGAVGGRGVLKRGHRIAQLALWLLGWPPSLSVIGHHLGTCDLLNLVQRQLGTHDGLVVGFECFWSRLKTIPLCHIIDRPYLYV